MGWRPYSRTRIGKPLLSIRAGSGIFPRRWSLSPVNATLARVKTPTVGDSRMLAANVATGYRREELAMGRFQRT